jgi:nucleotide-binding universal stress UspA family protein
MATATLQHPTTEQSRTEAIQKDAAPLLVATDASSGSDAALRAARAIARRTGQPIKLLAVYAPMPAVAGEIAVASVSEADERKSLEIAIDDQMERLGIGSQWRLGNTYWSLDIALGDPAATIASTAGLIGADLIIMGLGGHELFDRIFGEELVVKVLRLGQTPVLAVAPSFHALPLHAMAAVDFSASSELALSLGAALVAPGGRITLAHVAHDAKHPPFFRELSPYVGALGQAYDRLITDTEVAAGVRFERRVLVGNDASDALLAHAAESAPDLIIAGSHGHGFLTRLVMGSVSTSLVRKAGRSILVAPPIDSSPLTNELPRNRFEFFEWAERLEEFTRRNEDRRCTMEVIDPAIGAQLDQKGTVFKGASYDSRDGRLHIMCGDGGEHLTRTITGVTGIQVLRDASGADAFLRVAHGRGQTLLTLER